MSDTLLSPAFPASRPVMPLLVLRAPPRPRLPGIPAPALQGDDEATIRITPAGPVAAPPAAPPRSRGRVAGREVARILGRIAAMCRARGSRHDLASLDDRMLRDIGVSRLEALAEAGRWPWDLDRRGIAAR